MYCSSSLYYIIDQNHINWRIYSILANQTQGFLQSKRTQPGGPEGAIPTLSKSPSIKGIQRYQARFPRNRMNLLVSHGCLLQLICSGVNFLEKTQIVTQGWLRHGYGFNVHRDMALGQNPGPDCNFIPVKFPEFPGEQRLFGRATTPLASRNTYRCLIWDGQPIRDYVSHCHAIFHTH